MQDARQVVDLLGGEAGLQLVGERGWGKGREGNWTALLV